MKRIIIISFILICLMTANVFGSEVLSIGDIVEFGTYNESPIQWIVINSKDNEVMLQVNEVIMTKAFDGKGTDGKVNTWEKSSIRTWLNSNEDRVKYDEHIPSSTNVKADSYDLESGFLCNFTEEEVSILVDKDYKVVLHETMDAGIEGGTEYFSYENRRALPSELIANYDDAYYKMLNDKVYLLSLKELLEYVELNELGIRKFDSRNVGSDYRLRTIGQYDETVITVMGYDDVVHNSMFYRNYYSGGVAPVINIDLEGLTIIGGGSIISPFTIHYEKPTFEPKGASEWAKSSIREIYNLGILPSKFEGRFTEKITREEFAELSVLLYEFYRGKDIEPYNNPFTDTENPYVIKAYKIEVVSGVSKNKFAPESFITREQMAKMFYNTLQAIPGDFNNYRKTTVFNDQVEISNYAIESIEYLRDKKIIGGNGKNYFLPKNNASVQESIVIMSRMINSMDNMIDYEDITTNMSIALNDKGDFITSIQELLYTWTSNNNLSVPVFVEGVVDEDMVSYVKAFEKAHDLTQNGVITYDDYRIIHNEKYKYSLSASQKRYLDEFNNLEGYSLEDKEFVQDLIDELFGKKGMTDLEKLEATYKYVTENVRYDWDYASGKSKSCANTPLDVLRENNTVCAGYAKSMSFLLAFADIPSYYISGDVGYKKVKIGHAWNLVLVDDVFNIIDATWDEGKTEDEFENFMISETEMMNDMYREWNIKYVPFAKL